MRARSDRRDRAAGTAVPRLRLCHLVLGHDGRARARLVETLIGRRGLGDQPGHRDCEQRRLPAAVLPAARHPGARDRAGGKHRRTCGQDKGDSDAGRIFRRAARATARRRRYIRPTSSTPTTSSRMFRTPTVSSPGSGTCSSPAASRSIEVPYVRDLVARLEFDTIYHEHFSYYSLSAVERCAPSRADVPRRRAVPIHGGSLRLFVAHAGGQASARVAELLAGGEIAGLLALRLLPRLRRAHRATETSNCSRAAARLKERGGPSPPTGLPPRAAR